MRKKVLALFALICCLVMALGVFAACNDDTGTGGDGAGDSIFNEGASLDDILTALENSESMTVTQEQEAEGTDERGAYQATLSIQGKANRNMITLTYAQTYRTGETEELYNADQYIWLLNGVEYVVQDVIRNYDGTTSENITAEKCLEQLIGNRSRYEQEIDGIERLLTVDENGNIVVNTDNIFGRYVEGSAYVRLLGNSLELGYTEDLSDAYSTDVTSYKWTISGVNATTVEIPDEIKALEAEAEWPGYVNYNGVDYRKETDTDGSEYYVVIYNSDGAPIEETINTLPVRR